jgi:intracellular sulfur oxidation DsrE/DsrF family protein
MLYFELKLFIHYSTTMKYLHLIVLGLLICSSTEVEAQDKKVKPHQVVMQLNSADTAVWSGMLGNIRNFQKVWPGNVMIEVVVHGKALNFLVSSKSHLVADVEAMTKQGVVFNACENTMNKYGIKKEMLISSVSSVPSGVAELVVKQEEGWSYIKTGY